MRIRGRFPARLAAGALLAGLLAQAPRANPFAFPDFSATMYSGLPTNPGVRIYRAGDAMRVDLPSGGYVILALGAHRAFVITPTSCAEMSSLQPQSPNPLTLAADMRVEAAPAGAAPAASTGTTESLDGHACAVQDLVVTPTQGLQAGQSTRMKVWEAQDLNGFPVRIDVIGEATTTLRLADIRLAAPDANLLRLPANCLQPSALH